jgi:phosphatidylglycerol---prolipoprotein diacylglyceryl transferase
MNPRTGYTLFMVLGIAAFFLAKRLFPTPKPPGLSGLERFTLGFTAFVGGTLSAKLPFLLGGDADLWSLATWSADGKTITTGLVGAYLSTELCKLWLGIRVRVGDGYAIPLAAALMVGRWGCYINGCCAGMPCSLPWAADFGDGIPRHPTQIYESLFHAVMLLVLVKLNARNAFATHRLKLYLIAYCLFRFTLEFLRIEPIVWQGLTYYQLVVAGFGLFLAGQWAFARKITTDQLREIPKTG